MNQQDVSSAHRVEASMKGREGRTLGHVGDPVEPPQAAAGERAERVLLDAAQDGRRLDEVDRLDRVRNLGEREEGLPAAKERARQ